MHAEKIGFDDDGRPVAVVDPPTTHHDDPAEPVDELIQRGLAGLRGNVTGRAEVAAIFAAYLRLLTHDGPRLLRAEESRVRLTALGYLSRGDATPLADVAHQAGVDYLKLWRRVKKFSRITGLPVPNRRIPTPKNGFLYRPEVQDGGQL